MKNIITYSIPAILLCAQHAVAGTLPLAIAPLSTAPLPLDISGIAAIAGASLILGVQLIKRRK